MIIDTYCLVFTTRLTVRLTKINFLIARLIAIKNFNRAAALIISKTKTPNHDDDYLVLPVRVSATATKLCGYSSE